MKVQLTLRHSPYMNAVSSSRVSGGCAHGNAPGSCPICSGGGGGGASLSIKPKATPKELGLLTWADLLPGWYAMQAANRLKEYNEARQKFLDSKSLNNGTMMYQTLLALTSALVLSKTLLAIQNLKTKLFIPINETLKTLLEPMNNLYNKTLITISVSINELVQMLTKFKEKFEHSTEIFRAAMERFLSEFSEKLDNSKKQIINFTNKFKKDLLSLLLSLSGSFENKSNDNKGEKFT